MEPTQELIDDIYRQKVLRARAMPPEEKLVGGIELFRQARTLAEDGIRHQFPHADDAEVRRIFLERLKRLRRIEEVGWISTPKSAE